MATLDQTAKELGFKSLADLKTALPSSQTPTATPAPAPIKRTVVQDPAVSQAEGYLSSFQQPESVESIANRKRKESQGMIDSIKQLYADEFAQVEARRNERLSEQNAMSVVSGVSGSGRSFAARDQVNVASDKERQALAAEQSAKLAAIYGKISEDAVAEAKQARLDATAQAEGILKRDAEKQTKAVENLKLMAASGAIDYDAFSSNPQNADVYNYALRTFDGNEDALRSFFVLNRPQEQVIDKMVEGNKYIQVYQHPITGKQRIETTTLPFDVPVEWQTADLGGYVMFYDPKNPDNNKKISKTLTPTQAAAQSGGGVASPSGLSPLSQSIYANPALLNNLTPTEKGKVLKELAANGMNLEQFATQQVTAAQREQIAGFDDLIREANNAADLLSRTKLNTGILASNVGKVGAALGVAPNFTEYRSIIDNFGSALLKLRSGAAVTPQEFTRIAGFIPAVTDDQKTAQIKINRFVEEMTKAQQNYVARSTQTTQQIQQSVAPQQGDYQAYLDAINN